MLSILRAAMRLFLFSTIPILFYALDLMKTHPTGEAGIYRMPRKSILVENGFGTEASCEIIPSD
jgi:hypothetical protein